MELTITKDKNDLERLEAVIRKNLQSFYEVGRALAEIRDEELYKIKNGGEYQTFEAYCRGEWDFARRTAYQFIESVEVMENVRHGAQNGIMPENERQARPLVKLKADQQREAWQKAVETAPEGKVTAAHVYKIVKDMQKNESRPAPKETHRQTKGERIPTYAFHFADIAISQLERINLDDPKREASFNRVMKWIQDHI